MENHQVELPFKDRSDAGKKLAKLLEKYKNHHDAIVIALPRGGVVTGYEVAKALSLPLDIFCPRKIGAPHNREFAIGAITETGDVVLNEQAINMLGVDQNYLAYAIRHEREVAENRLKSYRKSRPPLNLQGKIVILVDDGIATGSTMKAALKTAKTKGAKKTVLAVPVAPLDIYERFGHLADEVICYATPSSFSAVGQFYLNFTQTEDDEVISLLNDIQS